MAVQTKLINETHVRTGLVRFSFVSVFEMKHFDDASEDRYMITLLIPKDDKQGLDTINKAIENAKARGIKEKWDGKLPKKLDLPLRDGEEKEDYEGFAECMFINAKSRRRPKVVDKNLNPILDPEDLYSGCYGLAGISFFPYKTAGNCGIGVALDNVMKLKDGEALGGGTSVDTDFGDVDISEFGDDDDDDL